MTSTAADEPKLASSFADLWPFRAKYHWGKSPLDDGVCSGWYLEYVSFDSMENRISDARHARLVELSSVTEAGARAEAVDLWARRGSSYEGYDGQMYPREPALVYRRLLGVEP